MKPPELLRAVPKGAAAPATSDAPPTADQGVAMRVVREERTAAQPDPADVPVLRAFLARFETAGISAETLTRALGVSPATLAAFAEGATPPRWFILALAGVATAHGIGAAELEWLRAVAERAE